MGRLFVGFAGKRVVFSRILLSSNFQQNPGKVVNPWRQCRDSRRVSTRSEVCRYTIWPDPPPTDTIPTQSRYSRGFAGRTGEAWAQSKNRTCWHTEHISGWHARPAGIAALGRYGISRWRVWRYVGILISEVNYAYY